MGARRVRVLVACAALIVALTGCSVDALVTVRMREDGSGVVSVRVVLDAAAVRAATVGSGSLTDRVRTSDLTDAGWKVTPWRELPGGGAVIAVRKGFAQPGDVAGVVREINGPKGPLRRFSAVRDASTFTTGWNARGTVDLRTIELGIADDPELVADLTNERVDVAGVEQRIAGSALTGLRIRGRVELPGGEVRTTAVKPGERAVIDLSADETAYGRIALVAAGIAAAGLAIVVLVVGERRSRRRRSVRPARIPRRS